MEVGSIVKHRHYTGLYGIIVSRNKTKKRWHRKITIMWPDCFETVPVEFAKKEYLEKI